MILRKLILIALALSLLGLAGALATERLSDAAARSNITHALSAFFFAAVLVLLAWLALLYAMRMPRSDTSEGEMPPETP